MIRYHILSISKSKLRKRLLLPKAPIKKRSVSTLKCQETVCPKQDPASSDLTWIQRNGIYAQKHQLETQSRRLLLTRPRETNPIEGWKRIPDSSKSITYQISINSIPLNHKRDPSGGGSYPSIYSIARPTTRYILTHAESVTAFWQCFRASQTIVTIASHLYPDMPRHR